MGKKSGEIEIIRINSSKNSYNEGYNLLERPQIPPTIKSNSIPSQNTALWKINKAYLWPRSKGWMRALKASIQPAATKVTNMLYLSKEGVSLACGKFLFKAHEISVASSQIYKTVYTPVCEVPPSPNQYTPQDAPSYGCHFRL